MTPEEAKLVTVIEITLAFDFHRQRLRDTTELRLKKELVDAEIKLSDAVELYSELNPKTAWKRFCNMHRYKDKYMKAYEEMNRFFDRKFSM